MGTSERPDASLLVLLLVGTAAAGIGFGLWLGSPTCKEVVFWISGAVVALVVALLAWRQRCRWTLEDARGVAAIALAVTTAAAIGWSVIHPFTADVWVQVVVLCVAVLLSLALVATEWSRIGLFVAAIVFGVLVMALIVRIGHRAEQLASVANPLADATTEVAALEKQAKSAAVKTNESAQASFQAALIKLNDSMVGAPPRFSELGSKVWGYLSETQPNIVRARVAIVNLLSEDVSAERTQQSLAVRDAAVAAFDAVPGAPKKPPSRAAVDKAIAATRCASDRSTCADGEKPQELSESLHELKVALAGYRSAVSPDDEALKAQAAEVATQKAEPIEISLWAAAAGPPVIIKSISENDSLALVPGPVGWIILGLLALLVLRALMRVNATQMPGPVTVGEVGDAALKGVLRVALLKNLKTPAAAPGSAVAQSITDLSGFAGPEATALGKVFAAISNAVSPARGFSVDVDVVSVESVSTSTKATQSGSTPAGDVGTDRSTSPTRVLVRVSNASTQESIGSAIFERESAPKAVQTAGLWAAGFLLRRSSRIPSWASWNEGTAAALDAANAQEPGLASLEEAAKTAPTSGWILVLYGNELELEGRTLDAVGVYARAVAVHPRYLIARYRLAVALGMSAHDDATAWTAAPIASRIALVTSLRQVAVRLKVRDDLVSSLQLDPEPDSIRELSRELLTTIVDDMSLSRTWAGSLRRSERSMDWLGWWHGGRRSNESTKWLAKSALPVYGGADLADVVSHSERPDSSWQVSYNLACHYASTSPGAALNALELCLMRPGIEELKRDWVERDPDLAGIAASPRFAAFRARLEQGGNS